jgi:hypothetical protein
VANSVPILTISSPQPNAVVGGSPFNVAGLVTAQGMPEPVTIYSVTVQIDSQPAVHATLERLRRTGDQPVQVEFSATAQITDNAQDPHTVTVTVASSANIAVTGTVYVTVDLRTVAPAAWVDVRIPPELVDTDLESVRAEIAQKLYSLGLQSYVGAMNKIRVRPSFVSVSGSWMPISPPRSLSCQRTPCHT